MFAIAHLALNRLLERTVQAAVVTKALCRFDETCLRLTQGQHADMEFESRDQVHVEEYMEMITGKTAVLLSLCAELGALIAGSSPETIAHYATFGKDLGLAFQVKDDILGIWGDESRTGKSAATDVVTRKKTLPILYGLSKSTKLRQLYMQSGTTDDFVRQVVQELDACEARAYASSRASHYSQNARAHLEAAGPAEPAAAALYLLADMLLTRDS
jgi:geranylgeranyl diphosphate synthase type I